ncbi:MAG: DUF1800 domain-containing protein [Verrucomicrobiota bacterium]
MLKPLPESQWTLQTARHLIARAGFDAPPEQVESLYSLGLTKAVDSLIQFQTPPPPRSLPKCAEVEGENQREFLKKLKSASPDERERLKKEARREMILKLQEFQGWWLQRMIETPDPLQEKLALFWHGHFATSFEKVKSPHLMWTQNEIFRNQGMGKFSDLLTSVSLDPAMLIYLDGNENQAEHPNENFAREVMELFCLGEGHYSEKDIQESARAFTGWKVRKFNGRVDFLSSHFDSGSKTILGKTAPFTAKEALQQIAAQPACADWICNKLWNFFASMPDSQAVAELSQLFQKNGGEIRSILKALFTSEAFYSANVIDHQIKSPVHWLISTVRLLERDLPPPIVCINLLTQLGQTPLRPPNVKGWDGGIAWITTANLLNRYNYASLLVEGVNIFKPSSPPPTMEMQDDSAAGRQNKLDKLSGRLANHLSPVPLEKIISAEEMKKPDLFLANIQKRFLVQPLKPKEQETLQSYLSQQKNIDKTTALHAIRLLMSTTQYQLT